MERRRVRFFGRVQGVGFRATARGVAFASGVAGWVRNEPDGTVLCEVQGSEMDVQGFLDRLRARMAGNIERTDEQQVEPIPGDEGFRIAR